MPVPLSYLVNTKLLIERSYLQQIIAGSIFFEKHFPTQPENRETINQKPSCGFSSPGIALTNDIDSVSSGDEIVFYHRLFGPVFAYPKCGFDDDCNYVRFFSTMQFLYDLETAEKSPDVIAHFLHINSGGGEAWMLDIAAEAMRNCKKPIYAFIEQYCCSAAYWLASHATVVKSFSSDDTIGSVGCMVHGYDVSDFLKQMGIKEIEVYATKSDLKNKMVNDLMAGKPDEYIKERLDPLQLKFETSIRAARPQLAALPEDHPAMRGITYLAPEAVEIGLIDGILSNFNEAVREAHNLGIRVRENNQTLTNI